ncbi:MULTISPECIES: ATP-binding protein [unclassified Streptomyces]|uniref:ATP-binding protein n=1 Tax=unclassified Streptomyces TaxID=2593676 RepID=UPI0009905BA2|nr:hypothetical protein B1K54_20950 [Streptomyces sp. fd1-xmd]
MAELLRVHLVPADRLRVQADQFAQLSLGQILGEPVLIKEYGSALSLLLCVSELATNALRYGVPPGRGYLLRLFGFEDATVRAEVHDGGPGLSRIAGRPHGRGLAHVEALADDWGVVGRAPGKIVWCEFRIGCR